MEVKTSKWIRDEMFVSGRGECVCKAVGYYVKVVRRVVALPRMLPFT